MSVFDGAYSTYGDMAVILEVATPRGQDGSASRVSASPDRSAIRSRRR